ncbi:hypothetical protein [Chlorobium limicola]|nr:hypothetical protein [Chlorobium limicola]
MRIEATQKIDMCVPDTLIPHVTSGTVFISFSYGPERSLPANPAVDIPCIPALSNRVKPDFRTSQARQRSLLL